MFFQKILFTEDECNKIKDLNKENPQTWDFNDRHYNSLLIRYNEESKWVFDKLKLFFEENTNHKIKKLREEIHFHIFKNGSFFLKHNDNIDNRLYTIGVVLNENYVGGDFMIYTNPEIKINKKIGNAYIFDVTIEHEITKLVEGERNSLLWFLKNENIEISFSNKRIL